MMRLGIISTAHINRLVIPEAHRSQKVELKAVASRDQGRAERYAQQWAIPRPHGSYEELLADRELDAVYISLPNSMHVEWSIRALQAGKHVLCEKPLSRHAADVERAFGVAERAKRILMEAFMYRHNPQTKRLVELVQAGTIGELRLIRAAFSFNLDDPENVRLRADVEGGSLMDVGCYCVSGSRLLGGEPDRVYAEQVVGETGVDVRFHATMHFPSGVHAQFDCGLQNAERDELEAVGSEGTIFLDDPWHCRNPVLEIRRGTPFPQLLQIEPENSYRLELENLADAIAGEADPLLGREDAVGQAHAIEALYRSAETAHPVSP